MSGLGRNLLLAAAIGVSAISSAWAQERLPDGRAKLVAPECVASRPALATTGSLMRTAQRLRAGGPLRVLAIGSSSTAGTGTSGPAYAYPARLADELKERLPGIDIRIEAAGVAGETASQTITRLERDIGDLHPDLVVWQVGTNDALADVGEDSFRAIVERGVTATSMAGADMILLDQQFFPNLRRKDRYERFVSIVREVGLTKRACVFGRYALMKAWGERSDETLRAMLSADGFHMSDRGHACMARILADEIVKAARQPALTASAPIIP
jgi:lysophospholipase L1-like esterase